MELDRDAERRLAIAALLTYPDPPELRRGYRLRLDGKVDRYALVAVLTAAFVQRRLLELNERRAECEHSTVAAGDHVPIAARPRPVIVSAAAA